MENDQRGRIQARRFFQHKCLRKILKVYWPMKVSNEEISERSGTRTIGEQVRARRWKWLRHVLRMSSDQNPKIALTWAPKGKRRRGRPRKTWRRTINKEREHLGFKTWRDAEVVAKDRVAWRRRIDGPILHEERRERWWWILASLTPLSQFLFWPAHQ